MGQLSLFPEAPKPITVIKEEVFEVPKVGQWITLFPISDKVGGGSVYTSCEDAKVIKIIDDLFIAVVPKTHRYHDKLEIHVKRKDFYWLRVLGPDDGIEELEELLVNPNHHHVGETDVPTAKEMKKRDGR